MEAKDRSRWDKVMGEKMRGQTIRGSWVDELRPEATDEAPEKPMCGLIVDNDNVDAEGVAIRWKCFLPLHSAFPNDHQFERIVEF